MYAENNPLTYILTSAKLDATGQRWVASLTNYDFTIHYLSGKQNVEADTLSRVKWEYDDAVVIKAIMVQDFNANTMVPYPFDPKMVYIGNIDLTEVLKLSGSHWQREQSNDVDIGPVVELVKGGQHLQYICKEGDLSGMHVLLKYKQGLFIRNHLLYRRIKLKNHDSVVNQFVLP